LFSVLSQSTGLTDGQTDSFLIARPRLHSMQRGKNYENQQRYHPTLTSVIHYRSCIDSYANPSILWFDRYSRLNLMRGLKSWVVVFVVDSASYWSVYVIFY